MSYAILSEDRFYILQHGVAARPREVRKAELPLARDGGAGEQKKTARDTVSRAAFGGYLLPAFGDTVSPAFSKASAM